MTESEPPIEKNEAPGFLKEQAKREHRKNKLAEQYQDFFPRLKGGYSKSDAAMDTGLQSMQNSTQISHVSVLISSENALQRPPPRLENESLKIYDLPKQRRSNLSNFSPTLLGYKPSSFYFPILGPKSGIIAEESSNQHFSN